MTYVYVTLCKSCVVIRNKQLQQLIGRLNWGAKVIKGGRTFLRRLIDLMCSLKRRHHHIRLNTSAKADIQWWAQYIGIFNGTAHFIDEPVPNGIFTTDACVHGGAGAFKADWFYTHWDSDFPEVTKLHINLKEIFSVYLASLRWAESWRNKHIVVYTDNTATMFMINKGSTRNSVAMSWLRQLFWLSATHNFQLTAKFIKGKDNVTSDFLSRLHQFKPCEWYKSICTQGLDPNIPHHISQQTLMFLLFQNPSGKNYKRSVLDRRKQPTHPPRSQPTQRCEMHF